jgi:ubiquinone/menaquinone biosynthesis C-methylase UbiE
MKRLASVQEMNTPAFRAVIDEVNEIGRRGGLRVVESTTKLWEYPFCWFEINRHAPARARILDVGTERSPFPFFLALQGYNVTINDIDKKWKAYWDRAARELKTKIEYAISPSERLPFPDSSFDVYLSVSVIEHIKFKDDALREAARVLRPGGLLILTFDMLEENYDMVYPKEFGTPLTIKKFGEIFQRLPFFQSLEKDSPWNVDDIPDFLKWHQSTKPIHSYVTGGAVFKRNGVISTRVTAFNAFGQLFKMLYAYQVAPFLMNSFTRIYRGSLRRLKS